MEKQKKYQQVPVYKLVADHPTITQGFKVYHFTGSFPNPADLLVPHRKDHYLIVFVRRGGHRQWIDMTPVVLKNNSVYFTGPGHIIVKEGLEQLWSTGIAFTEAFLALEQNNSLKNLPILLNPHNQHELLLAAADVPVIEDMLAKIVQENDQTDPLHGRMLSAYLTVLLTYLSRLYTEQYKGEPVSVEQVLLQRFHRAIDEGFHKFHQVADYASLLNISAGHLSEVVKMQSGKPAIKHIHERLILEARRWLFHTDNSAKEIAFTLGFVEASYFNRFFKRESGVTPAAYRASIREMYH